MSPLIKEYLALEDRTTEDAHRLATEIMTAVGRIVKAIIFTHRFTAFDDYEELYSVAMGACWSALFRFNPYYFSTKTGKTVTSFNYFSLVAKQCLLYTTLHHKKHRNLKDVDDYQAWLSCDQSTSSAVESIITQVKDIYNDDKYYKKMSLIFIRFLSECQSFNRRDFFSYAKSYGVKVAKSRRFMTDLQSHIELYEGVESSVSLEVDSIRDQREVSK